MDKLELSNKGAPLSGILGALTFRNLDFNEILYGGIPAGIFCELNNDTLASGSLHFAIGTDHRGDMISRARFDSSGSFYINKFTTPGYVMNDANGLLYSASGSGGGGTVVHADTTLRDADDHLQYLTDARASGLFYGYEAVDSISGALRVDIDNNTSNIVNISGYLVTVRELEDAWKEAYQDYNAEYVYTSGNLTDIDIYSGVLQLDTLFTKDFTYTSGNLTSILTTRISDSATLTKDFTYTSGNLSNVNTEVA